MSLSRVAQATVQDEAVPVIGVERQPSAQTKRQTLHPLAFGVALTSIWFHGFMG
jgi:hypothetical protein